MLVFAINLRHIERFRSNLDSEVIIRLESPEDYVEIDVVTAAAFATVSYGTEHDGLITGLLRENGALSLSLVAVEGAQIVGHVAFSPVVVTSEQAGWFALGPISVRPDRHGEGIGGKLIREGLVRLKARRAKGCVLMGNPSYYGRFGFEAHTGLRLDGQVSPFLQALAFAGTVPSGEVEFHSAFTEPE